MSAKNYITPRGFSLLKAEYLELFQKERPKVVETVSWAASNGDRSENADYLYGKKRLREIDKRLKFLSDRLDSSEVVDPQKITSDIIVFGATVTYSDEDGKLYHYQIVGEDEFDVKAGRISWKSPVARSLLGRKVGDEIVLKKPKGNEEIVYIEKIEFK